MRCLSAPVWTDDNGDGELPEQRMLKQLQGWARGGTRRAELDSVCGFTADCLAVGRDGDTLACIGGDGDGKKVRESSSSSLRTALPAAPRSHLRKESGDRSL